MYASSFQSCILFYMLLGSASFVDVTLEVQKDNSSLPTIKDIVSLLKVMVPCSLC